MHESETQAAERPAPAILSNCPQCDADLAVLRVISGSAGSEYWTLRCTRCGGIHLDIVKAASPSSSRPLL
jgi:uncharacterized Zn finger protein